MAKSGRKVSPALAFVSLAWESEGSNGAGRSWERLNDTMSSSLLAAIRGQFRFDEGDIAAIKERFRGGFWFGVSGASGLGERFYAVACAVEREHGENRSAALSFEAWKRRPPFIFKDEGCISGRRLAIGSRLKWRGESVKVTSFADDGMSLTACSYEFIDPESAYPREKVARRFKVTIDALREANAATVKALRPVKVVSGEGGGS